jgi:pheromone shutdown-related protein TraB
MSTHENSDIHRITLGDREFVLVGTAHISKDSVAIVKAVIQDEQPDTVCVELDEQRHRALRNPRHWESLNLVQVLRQGQAPFLLANLTLASFQKRMGLQTGVKPGAELAAAAETADQMGIELQLVDREIRTTLLRAWRKAGFWKKMQLFSTLLVSLFDTQELDEEELTRLRQTDTLSAMLDEMSEILPAVKTILVDERDTFMAYRICRSPGNKVVAIVGAAHMPGIVQKLGQEITAAEIDNLSMIPEKTTFSKLIPWLIPAIVFGLFIYGFMAGNTEQLASAAVAWILANGLLSALGTLLALGHPLTILAAFIAAPITSLNPTIGAGFVTGIVQAVTTPPTVKDLESVSEDIAGLGGWWRNRLTRVLLVFLFSSLGSAAGTFVAFGWLKDLF